MRGTPPTPTGDLRAWALALVEYLDYASESEQEVLPRPVLLEHKIGTTSAVTDGILMYDPQLGRPVVSVNGVWRAINIT